MSAHKRHWLNIETEFPQADRLTLAEPLTCAEAVVRELDRGDADLLVEAARHVQVVRGDITFPTSLEEAGAMLAQFERLRHAGQANLYGVLRPDDNSLAGVISMRVGTDLVAECACWNRSDKGNREVTATGLNLLTSYAHRTLHIVQLWVLIDPVDPFTRRLAYKGGWSQGTADASGKVRFSSVG